MICIVTLLFLIQAVLLVDILPGVYITDYTLDQIEQVHEVSRIIDETVFEGITKRKAYSGYINIDEETDSNMFFMIFEANNGNSKAPLLAWMTGGPGCSDEIAFFTELGPYKLDYDTLELSWNEYNWCEDYTCIFIDNPLFAGLSYANTYSAIPNDEMEVATNYYKTITTLLTYFPEYAGLPLTILGESYGGHYTYSVGSYIVHNPHPSLNLARIGCGDGLTVPVNQMSQYADFAHAYGLIDGEQKKIVEELQDDLVSYIKGEKWSLAKESMGLILEYILTASGVPNEYNVSSYSSSTADIVATMKLFEKPEIRNALHAGDNEFRGCSVIDQFALWNDFFKTSESAVVDLLERGYPILVYSGNLDLVIPWLSQDSWTSKLIWSGQDKFNDAEREVVECEGEVAFSWKQAGNLAISTVWNSGHMVPADQPMHAKCLLDRFMAIEKE